MNVAKLNDLRVDLVRASESWQRGLLSSDGLAKLAKELGLGWFTEQDVLGLWRIGLLRADFISARRKLETSNLLLVDENVNTGTFIYCDNRVMDHRADGYGSSLQEGESREPHLDVRFHPYRLNVLYHVQRTLKIETANTQYLTYVEGIARVVTRLTESLTRWTSGNTFSERFDYWNGSGELAIVCEPVSYGEVYPSRDPALAVPAEVSPYQSKLYEMLVEMGRHEIEQHRQDLAFAAETMDANRSMYVLLRLMFSEQRMKLKGRLGAATRFLSMAEIIRRPAERALGKPLPEEDEIGPGQWMPGARKMLYGADRVFDAPQQVLRDYLTVMGLDFGTKVKCYVEGETELGAMSHAAGVVGGIEFVNLRGNVLEKNGKGLAFVDALANDMHSHVVSVVLLDADRADFVRALKKAAEEGRFFGEFYVAEPDFELANFSREELLDIALRLEAREDEVTATSERRARLMPMVAMVRSGKAFMRVLQENEITRVRKSEEWGKALMTFAIAEPTLPVAHARSGQKRPIVKAADLLMRARLAGFQRSVDHFQVDPTSGELVQRRDSGLANRDGE